MTTTNDNLLLVTIYISWRWFDFLASGDCLSSSTIFVQFLFVCCFHCMDYVSLFDISFHFSMFCFVPFVIQSDPIRSVPRCSICFVCCPRCSFDAFPFVRCALFSSGLGVFFCVRFFLTFIPCRVYQCLGVFGIPSYFRVQGIEFCDLGHHSGQTQHINLVISTFSIFRRRHCVCDSLFWSVKMKWCVKHTHRPLFEKKTKFQRNSVFVLNEQN